MISKFTVMLESLNTEITVAQNSMGDCISTVTVLKANL